MAQLEPTNSGYLDAVDQESTRPFKRRKFYRKRADDENFSEDLLTPDRVPSVTPVTSDDPHSPNAVGEQDGNESHLSVAEILRRRKAAQRRRGGIEFTNSATSSKGSPGVSESGRAVTSRSDAVMEMEAVVNRFAPQTGQVADVNKHMMAYIDSEITKRLQGQNNTSLASNGSDGNDLVGQGLTDLGIQRQPAALGKLQEIDLGPDSTLKNIERTEAAKKKLEGRVEEVEETTVKPRLRRDGKPWRGPRRRNSEDVKRDQIVEEVLKETRLELYDEPEAEAPNDDQAADDRIAEQFRREFLDAIASRRQKTGASTIAKPVKGAPVDDKMKGPKLGGSRSARAAMREQQEKAAKKK